MERKRDTEREREGVQCAEGSLARCCRALEDSLERREHAAPHVELTAGRADLVFRFVPRGHNACRVKILRCPFSLQGYLAHKKMPTSLGP